MHMLEIERERCRWKCWWRRRIDNVLNLFKRNFVPLKHFVAVFNLRFNLADIDKSPQRITFFFVKDDALNVFSRITWIKQYMSNKYSDPYYVRGRTVHVPDIMYVYRLCYLFKSQPYRLHNAYYTEYMCKGN